ncbi:MAG: right-handed parallel beta-helix repeat-containing protein [Planctomycetota bacterium]
MRGRDPRVWLAGAWIVGLLAGCAGGSGGSGSGADDLGFGGPDPPESISLVTSNGQVLIDWEPVDGASSYLLYFGFSAALSPSTAPSVQVASPPYVFEDLPSGLDLYTVITSVSAEGQGPPSDEQMVPIAPGSPERYFPDWADAPVGTELTFDYNGSLSSAQNGANLKAAMQGLAAGEQLEVGGGTYTVDSFFDLSVSGNASAPIRIVAREGETPVITRSDANQNTLNIGGGGAAYLLLRGFEITSGDIALRLFSCSNVWIDQCHIHDCAQNAIAANSEPTDHLYFTRNEIHSTAGTGEGIYLGGNFGNPVSAHSVIALNHVYDTAGSQGDGIEVKQGSYGTWIAENVVHDTKYPCILVYGTAGEEVNIVERNVCWNSQDNVMQVQGEAIVRNNLIMSGANGFYSSDHQDDSRDLTVVHNTIINSGGPAARLTSWDDRPGMVFANNACYSQFDQAIFFSGGSTGVEVSGNVAFGAVQGVADGYTVGGGLSDFVDVSWDATAMDGSPSPGGALMGAGDAAYGEIDDFFGDLRQLSLESGAADGP